ncbi:hypothetical protein PGB90_003502 [Kerria lacca]
MLVSAATTAAFHSAITPTSASSATTGDPLNFFSNSLHDSSNSLGFLTFDAITNDDLQSPSTPSSLYNNNNNNDGSGQTTVTTVDNRRPFLHRKVKVETLEKQKQTRLLKDKYWFHADTNLI